MTARRSGPSSRTTRSGCQFDADRDGLTGELRTLTATRGARLRAAAAGADRAALRRRAGRAGPQPDPGRAAPARDRPGLPGLARLVRRGLPGPPLRPPDPRHARERGRDHRRRLPRLRRQPPRPRPAGRSASPATSRRDELAPLLDATFGELPDRAACCPRWCRVAPRVGARRGAAPGDPAERGRLRPCRARSARPRLLRGLRRQLHPGRRRLQLAPAGGGAREARPRLFGLFLSLRARRGATVAGRRRHQQPAGRPIDRARAP